MSVQRPNFVVDAMLGNLAKKLRILGYDSKYFSSIKDEKVILIAKNEKRIILTKDEQLVKIAEKQNVMVFLIRGNNEFEQITQINKKIKLGTFVMDTNNSYCSVCNGKLQQIEKHRIKGMVPERVLTRGEKFWMCDICAKIYWEGTHFEKLREFVTKLNEKIT